MMKKAIIALCLAVIPVLASFGADMGGIQDPPLTPDAIVMEDSAGQEVLVLFYRVPGKHQKVGFMVGRADNQGTLLWDEMHYELKTSVLTAGGFSPAPIKFADKLYLIGRHREEGRHLIYNYFDSLDDLIAHTQDGPGKREYQALNVKGHPEHDHLSTALTPEGDAMLLAYYDKGGKHYPASLRCAASANSALSCKDVPVKSSKNKQPASLITLTLDNGDKETLWLIRDGNYAAFHRYNAKNNQWDALHRSGKISLPAKTPIGVLSVNNELQLYYNGEEGKGRTRMTSAPLTEALWSGDDEVIWVEPSKGGMWTRHAVKPIRYEDRTYVFYIRKVLNTYICSAPSYASIEAGEKTFHSQIYPVVPPANRPHPPSTECNTVDEPDVLSYFIAGASN